MCELGGRPKAEVVQVHTDSAVAKSLVSTRGLGRMRHLELKQLWLQECVQEGRLQVVKVSGATNIAGALAKYHDAAALKALLAPQGATGPRGGTVIPSRIGQRRCATPLLFVVSWCGNAMCHARCLPAFGSSIVCIIVSVVERSVTHILGVMMGVRT